jgi:hypothetical protein
MGERSFYTAEGGPRKNTTPHFIEKILPTYKIKISPSSARNEGESRSEGSLLAELSLPNAPNIPGELSMFI